MSLNLISSLSFLKSRLGGGLKGPAPDLFSGRMKAAAAATSIDLYGGVTESDLESSSSESEDEEEELKDEQDLEDEDDQNSSRYVDFLIYFMESFCVLTN